MNNVLFTNRKNKLKRGVVIGRHTDTQGVKWITVLEDDDSVDTIPLSWSVVDVRHEEKTD